MQNTCYHCFQSLESAGPCPHCGYDPAVDEGKYPLALKSGSILNGRYIVGRTLGQGGFGITYIAQDVQTGEKVAIKEYFPETMATRTGSHNVTAFSGQRQENFTYGMQCFLSEAQTLAQFIGTEHIVRVHSYFEENGTAYFVMDYVDGVSFQAYLKQKGGKIPWEEAKSILFPIMDALSVVHSKGIIHRDISPDNIYITSDGNVKLLDFGAARYSLGDKSRSLDVVLKAGYAPYEQYSRRGRQGPYTDVYAMAATFYYAISGHLPPESVDRMEEDLLVLPSSYGAKIPEAAEDALEKALAVRATERWQSMTEFHQSLQTAPAPDPTPFPFPTPEPDPERELGPEQERESDSELPAKPEQKPIPWKPILLGIVLLAVLVLGRNWISKTTHSKLIQAQTLATGSFHTIGLRTNGTVVAAGTNSSGRCDVSEWRDIMAVSAGNLHTVGLCADGTVTAVGSNTNGQCNVSEWTDIIAVDAGGYHTVGLRADGTVVTVGKNEYGQCDVSGWTDIVAIAAGGSNTVGLRADGTVVAVGFNKDGQCDVSGWTDIVAIDSDGYTVGLQSDGTVVAAGSNANGGCDVSKWTNIIAVAAGTSHIVGLQSDGTVVAVGRQLYLMNIDGTVVDKGTNQYGRCDVSEWTDIVAIDANNDHTVGLRSDGTVVAVGRDDFGECNLSGWTNIRIPDNRT